MNEGIILTHVGSSEDRCIGRVVTAKGQIALGYYVHVHGSIDWYTTPYRYIKEPGRYLTAVDLPQEMVSGDGLSDLEIMRRVVKLLELGYLVDFTAGHGGYFAANVFVFREEKYHI